MNKKSKKIDKRLADMEREVNDIAIQKPMLLNGQEPLLLDLTQEQDSDIVNPDMEYQENISAIEQDLQEITQKDKLTESYEQLYSDKNLEKITEIAPNDLGKISILLTYARQFKFKELEILILNNMRLRVSLRRKGREEHVSISQAEVLRDERQLKLAHRLDNRVNKG